MASAQVPWTLDVDSRPDGQVCRLSGELTRSGAQRFCTAAARVLKSKKPVHLDFRELTRMDSAGAAAVAQVMEIARSSGVSLTIGDVPPHIAATLDQIPAETGLPELKSESVLYRMGDWGGRAGRGTVNLLVFLSEAFAGTLRGLFSSKGRRKGSVIAEVVSLGADAVPVVAVIALLLGLILAFQAAYQLRTFGGAIYVANLVGVSALRELAPLMTAVVVSGRSGSAIAAEIGSMKVGEELDALEVMGIAPMRFLVTPRLLAVTLTQPLLTAMASLVTIAGGFVIAIYYLDLGFEAYLNQTLKALRLADLLNGLGKSVVFGWSIVLIGSYTGLRVKPSAEAVGKAATSAVVACIFALIIIDGVITTVTTLMR